MEEWRDVVGYEGLYMVSNCGRVKSLKFSNGKREKIMKLSDRGNGYLRVSLSKDGESKHYNVHRLVAIAFIPNPDNLPYVNHKDECKTNNNVDNLEWCTVEYNNTYGTAKERQAEKLRGRPCSEEAKKKQSEKMKGRHYHTEESKKRISEKNKGKNGSKVQCITTGEVFESINEASKKYNINQGNISACCRGKLKSAGKNPVTGEKMIWIYVD